MTTTADSVAGELFICDSLCKRLKDTSSFNRMIQKGYRSLLLSFKKLRQQWLQMEVKEEHNKGSNINVIRLRTALSTDFRFCIVGKH